jgi:hypothetical protein
MHRGSDRREQRGGTRVHVMEAVELAFGAIAGALVTGGLGLMIWPTQMAAMTRRRTDARRPTAAGHPAGPLHFRQSAGASRIRPVDCGNRQDRASRNQHDASNKLSARQDHASA